MVRIILYDQKRRVAQNAGKSSLRRAGPPGMFLKYYNMIFIDGQINTQHSLVQGEGRRVKGEDQVQIACAICFCLDAAEAAREYPGSPFLPEIFYTNISARCACAGRPLRSGWREEFAALAVSGLGFASKTRKRNRSSLTAFHSGRCATGAFFRSGESGAKIPLLTTLISQSCRQNPLAASCRRPNLLPWICFRICRHHPM